MNKTSRAILTTKNVVRVIPTSGLSCVGGREGRVVKLGDLERGGPIELLGYRDQPSCALENVTRKLLDKVNIEVESHRRKPNREIHRSLYEQDDGFGCWWRCVDRYTAFPHSLRAKLLSQRYNGFWIPATDRVQRCSYDVGSRHPRYESREGYLWHSTSSSCIRFCQRLAEPN